MRRIFFGLQRAAMDGTLDLFFSKDLGQFLTLRSPTVSMNATEMIEKSNNGVT